LRDGTEENLDVPVDGAARAQAPRDHLAMDDPGGDRKCRIGVFRFGRASFGDEFAPANSKIVQADIQAVALGSRFRSGLSMAVRSPDAPPASAGEISAASL